jgi:Putative MetA-pathway of phenol degradation
MMNPIGRIAGVALSLSFAPAASGQDLRDFCADRPGKGTPACTLDAGRIQAEMSLLDFTHERSTEAETDTTLVGDLLVRAGITETTELRFGWTPFGSGRTRDRLSNVVSHNSSVGDVTLGLRTNLRNPDGSGLSIAVQPSVVVPVGGTAVGAGTWAASLVVPISYQLTKRLQIALTPELDAAPDGNCEGRHPRYGGVFGLGFAATSTFNIGAEVAAFRDNDPSGHATNATADVTLAWTPHAAKDFQVDAGLYAGLNSSTPDLQAVIGIAKRF